MEKPKLFLVPIDALPRNMPTLLIKFLMPQPGEITPQEFVTASSDPNDDNVDYWGNWDQAKLAYTKGEAIGQFAYVLKAIPPGPLPCD